MTRQGREPVENAGTHYQVAGGGLEPVEGSWLDLSLP